MKLSHMGIFIRSCMLASLWISTLFLCRYTLVSVRMCNFAASNAVAFVTFTTSSIMSLILFYPKELLHYKFILYELLAVSSVANGFMGFYGPGKCIPNLPNVLQFSHGLATFSFTMTLVLLALAPKSELGILMYKDEWSDTIEETGNVEDDGKDVNNIKKDCEISAQ